MPLPWEKYAAAPTESGPWSKYGAPPPEAPLLGTEKTGTPGIPKPPLPEGLKQNPSAESQIHSGIFSGPGSRPMAQAIPQFANGDWKGGASNLIEGAGAALAPLAIPGAIAAPVAAGTAALAGFGAQKAGEGVTKYFGGGPDARRLAGDVGGLVGGGIGGKIGGWLSKIAAPLAESALGIRGAAREYGATPGKAILNETSGWRPGTIANEAQTKMTALTDDLETRAKNAGGTIDLTPARKVVQGAIDTARAGNSIPSELMPMKEHLEVPHRGFAGATIQPPAPVTMVPSGLVGPNGQPIMGPQSGTLPPPTISPMQDPFNFLQMKRRLGTDFTSFTPGKSTPESVDVANQAYGQMARDFNTAVPGGADLNQRIQSLIPVAQRAHQVDLNAGPMERIIDRATRPTGGMVAPLAALHAGGPLAAAGAITGQEMLASPMAKIAAARTANAIGQPLPVAQGALMGAKKKKDQ